MALSDNFYLILNELEKEKNWTSIPDTDPRIATLRKLARAEETPRQQRDGIEFGIHVLENGKFIRAFKSVTLAAESLEVSKATIKVYASSGGKRLYQGRYELRYCKKIKLGE